MCNEVITLITVLGTREDEAGYTIEGDTKEVEVYAELKSVKYTEYYAALGANTHAQIIFVVDPYDFELSFVEKQDSEQNVKRRKASKVRHNGTLYRIVRSYRTDAGMLELTCAEVE